MTQRWAIGAIALLSAAVFWPAVGGPFLQWDDVGNIVTNPHLAGWSWDSLRWMWSTHHQGPYQPLSWMSLAFDRQVWGLQPLGFHLTSIALHAVNACLLLTILQRLGFSTAAACLGALFFAVHPQRVESVAWITERRDVLSGCLALLSYHAYVRDRRGQAFAWFTAALLAKATAVGMVWVFIATDLWRGRRAWGEKAAVALIALAFGLWNLQGYHDLGILQSRYGLGERLLLAAHNVCFYVEKMVWPWPLWPYYELPERMADLGFVLPLRAGLALMAGVLVFSVYRRWPAVALGWGVYVLMIAPMSGLAQNGQQVAADRYTYLAMLPFAVGFAALSERGPRWRLGGLAAIAILAGLCVQQSRIWRSDEALWRHTVRHAPETSLAQFNLGALRLRAGDPAGARPFLDRGVQLRPLDVDMRLKRAVAAEGTGDLATAEEDYRWILARHPVHAYAANNLALLYARQGRLADALALLQQVTAAHPEFAEAHFNLGALWMQRGRTREGRQALKRAIALNPELAGRLPR